MIQDVKGQMCSESQLEIPSPVFILFGVFSLFSMLLVKCCIWGFFFVQFLYYLGHAHCFLCLKLTALFEDSSLSCFYTSWGMLIVFYAAALFEDSSLSSFILFRACSFCMPLLNCYVRGFFFICFILQLELCKSPCSWGYAYVTM